jgi:uncharacterized protein
MSTQTQSLHAGTIAVHSGFRFNVIDPRPEEVFIMDIAHALSNITRFTGHCTEFYSVAQHCYLVSCMVSPEKALTGLLHDATEAYLMDLANPIKKLPSMYAYTEIEDKLYKAIQQKFNLLDLDDEIHWADKAVMVTEMRDIMPKLGGADDWFRDTCSYYAVEPQPFLITPWAPKEAKEMFIMRYEELTGKIVG